MPVYHVTHSFPLTPTQKEEFAQAVTKLHAHAFTTPSMFVNVCFQSADATGDNHFIGGVAKKDTVNSVQAMVRTSDKRTKESFDNLAEEVETAWLQILGLRAKDPEDEEKVKKAADKLSESEKAAKQLDYVAFYPMLAVREKGFTIPEAGGEGAWFKKNKEQFQKHADAGDEHFKAMLKEVDERDDLKAWRE